MSAGVRSAADIVIVVIAVVVPTSEVRMTACHCCCFSRSLSPYPSPILVTPASFAGLPSIPPERQSHYIREFLFVCRVLLERQRLAAQDKATKSPSLTGEATGPSEVLSDGSGSSLHYVDLEQELRVPILQLRDPLGLFRDR